jgi:hypothetical protein
MAEVDYAEIGAEHGMSETEAKDMYDQWTQTEDPLTLDYPGDKFREFIGKQYASSTDEKEAPVEPTFAESAFLGFEPEHESKGTLASEFVDDEYSSEEDPLPSATGFSEHTPFLDDDLNDSLSDIEDDEFGIPKLTLTPLECAFDDGGDEKKSSAGSASFHLEKAVGFTYAADGLDEEEESEDAYAASAFKTSLSPVTTAATGQVRGIDDILAAAGEEEEEDDDEFLTQFASMDLNDTEDYAQTHAVHIRNAVGMHQKAVAGAMLKQAEQLVKSDASNRKGFFLVVPSEGACKQHHDHCADHGKRAEFVKSHLLKQAGAVESAALFDRPWKSLSPVATEYKFPSERDNTLIRTRDNREFNIADSVESVYQVKGVRKNIKVVYLAPEETARLV